MVPGKDHLPLAGRMQLVFFERLVRAYNSGAPDVYVGNLLDGMSSKSPKEVFTGVNREKVFSNYVCKGSKKGFWRLMA